MHTPVSLTLCVRPGRGAPPCVQEAAWQAKKEEEAKRKAEEAAAAIAAAEAGDQRKAEEAVAEIQREYQNWRAGGATSEAGRWRMVPAVGGGRGSGMQPCNRGVNRLSMRTAGVGAAVDACRAVLASPCVPHGWPPPRAGV